MEYTVIYFKYSANVYWLVSLNPQIKKSTFAEKKQKQVKTGFLDTKKLHFHTNCVTRTPITEYAVIVILWGKLVYWLVELKTYDQC